MSMTIEENVKDIFKKFQDIDGDIAKRNVGTIISIILKEILHEKDLDDAYRMGVASGYEKVSDDLKELAAEKFLQDDDKYANLLRNLSKRFKVKSDKLEEQRNKDKIGGSDDIPQKN